MRVLETRARRGPLLPGRGQGRCGAQHPLSSGDSRGRPGRSGGTGRALSAVLNRPQPPPAGTPRAAGRGGGAGPGRLLRAGRSRSGTVSVCSRRRRGILGAAGPVPALPGPPEAEERNSPGRPVVSQRPPGPSVRGGCSSATGSGTGTLRAPGRGRTGRAGREQVHRPACPSIPCRAALTGDTQLKCTGVPEGAATATQSRYPGLPSLRQSRAPALPWAESLSERRPIPVLSNRGRGCRNSPAGGCPGVSPTTSLAAPGERRPPVPVTHPRCRYQAALSRSPPGTRPAAARLDSIRGCSNSTGRGVPVLPLPENRSPAQPGAPPYPRPGSHRARRWR